MRFLPALIQQPARNIEHLDWNVVELPEQTTLESAIKTCEREMAVRGWRPTDLIPQYPEMPPPEWKSVGSEHCLSYWALIFARVRIEVSQ